MIRRAILIFITAFSFSAAAHGYVREDWDNGLPEGTEELQQIPVSPESIEDMTAAASLVIRGIVNTVDALDPEFEIRDGGSQRNYNMRRRMLAIVTVEEVYKGGFDSSTLSVEFISSAAYESPPLMDLEEGERAVLFLVPGPTPPHFAPVNYYAGKAPPYMEPAEIKEEIVESMKPEDVNEEDAVPEDPGSVSVSLRALTPQANPGAPAYITVVVYNNTRGEITLDTSLNPVKIFTVAGPDGERLSPTANFNAPEASVTRMAPDHFTGARYDLTKFFDMSKPGIYKARASILKPTWSSRGAPELIVSNTVSIVVGYE